jgi:hypothetical protein
MQGQEHVQGVTAFPLQKIGQVFALPVNWNRLRQGLSEEISRLN